MSEPVKTPREKRERRHNPKKEEKNARKSLAELRASKGNTNMDTLEACLVLARCLAAQGGEKFSEAEDLLREVIEGKRKALGYGHKSIAPVLMELSDVLNETGDKNKAREAHALEKEANQMATAA